MLAEVPVIEGLCVCVCVLSVVSLYPMTPLTVTHCEFVCLVDACALKNTNERQAAKSCAVSSQEITPHEKILLTNQ